MNMKTTQKLWLLIRQQNTKKLNRLVKYQSATTSLSNQERCLSTLQQPKLDPVFLDGVLKSPFPDIIVPTPTPTIDQFIWENLDKWPDHVAMECGLTGRKYTFSQLRTLSKRFSVSLRKQGFQPGDVLAVMLPNMPEYPIALLGALEAGLIITTINPIYTAYELAHQIQDSGAKAIVTLAELADKIKSAKLMVESKTKNSFSLLAITINESANAVPKDSVNFNEFISESIDTSSSIRPCRSFQDIALLPYSSGTTGLSKGVELTHANLVSSFYQLLHPRLNHVQPTTKDHQDVVAGVLPFFHIYGLSVILLRILGQGGKMVTLPKFDPVPFLSVLKDHKTTILYVAPPLVLFLSNHPSATSAHFSSLKFIVNGAGPISGGDAERLIAKSNTNFQFSQAYGLTETSPAVFVTPNCRQDYVSVGLPVPSTTAKILKQDGTLGAIGETGEICIKGPQVMKGYHNKPEATKEVFDNEGYFHTGDVGYYDEEGRFYIVERMKELIKVKGYQVPPAELEAILRTNSAVLDAAVIGVPDDKTGEKPLAFVVVKKGSNVKGSELQDFVVDKVAPYKKLSAVVFVDSIPKSASGKILRRILKENYFDSKTG